MTLLGKLKLGFRVVVIAVAVMTALNVGELLWINSQQGVTDQTVKNSQTAGQLGGAVAKMTSSIDQLADAVFAEISLDTLKSDFDAGGAAGLAAIDSILASSVLSDEDTTMLQRLRTQLIDYTRGGDAIIASPGADMPAVLSSISPVKLDGIDMSDKVNAYRNAAGQAITPRLDRLGFVALICLIVTTVLGVGAVVMGLLINWRLPRSIGRTLNEAATGIGSSAAELMAVASQVAVSAAQTAASTNETNVTVEEVKQTAVLAHEKASSAAESAQASIQVADSGRMMVEETAAGIEQMQSQMDIVFQTINRLSEQTQAAGDIVTSVNDLAERSNLLSVNASIEAAKAGEYGKGFTVVAQEVKSLAEQSKQAVTQVRTMLSEIQKASQTAVQSAAQGREAVEAGRQRSMEAAEFMRSLADGAADDAQSWLQVAASSRQQLAGMEQIAQAIESIDEAGNQSVAGTRQVEQEVKHLQELAARLKKLVQTEASE